MYRDIGSNIERWNNLYLGWQVTIGGGVPWLGKVLVSDATGLATWSSVFSGTTTASGITGGTQGYITKFGTWGNGIVNSLFYETGSYVALGSTTPTSRFEIWSGATTTLFHMRGTNNLGIGLSAVRYQTTGTANVGIGPNALRTLTTGYSNAAVGEGALYGNTQWYFNAAIGAQSLYSNTIGNWNVAMGNQALWTNLDGSYNVALGWQALYSNSANDNNIAIGYQALRATIADSNIGIGFSAGSGITSWTNNIVIGTNAQAQSNTASNQLNIGNWIYGSGGNIGIGQPNPVAKLDISGTIKITGWTPGVGKFLMSDATGLATWSSTLSGATATGITGGTQNYIPKFGTGGTGLYSSQIFDNGVSIGIGTGANLTAKLNIDSGSGGFSWLRFLNINSTSAVTSTNIVGLGVNGSGEVVPISNGDVIVYDGITTSTPSPNPNNATRQVSYDFNQYFRIPAKQSFVITDGLSPWQNAPYIGENATSSVCEWTGTYGTGIPTCPTGDFPGSPYNSFTMSARADSNYGYQIGLAYRGDIQLMARSGKFRDGNDAGSDVDFDDYGSGLYLGTTSTPAPWYKVLTLPTNQVQWFYIDTGYTGQWNTTGKAGMIGIGTTDPNYGLDIRSTVGMMNRVYFTGAVTTAATPPITFDGDTNMGIFRPAADTLAVTTSGTERFRVFSDGNMSIGTTTNSAKLRVEGQVMITGGSPGLNKILVSDATGLASWWTAPFPCIVWGGGTLNTCYGTNSLSANTTGSQNTAYGYNSLWSNTTGSQNTANGYGALFTNTGGSFNTADGHFALHYNNIGSYNTSAGYQSLYFSYGNGNTANGFQSLPANTAGANNTAIGYQALQANTTGNTNIGVGYQAGTLITTGSNNIAIGNNSQVQSATASNQLSIGNWIYGVGGNIGIWVSNPSAKLEVNGQIEITGGSPGAGKVLTSDAVGLASWQTPSGGGGVGVCTIASVTITNSAVARTCTGMPASTAVAVTCTPNGAFSTPNTTAINCRANGTADSVTCNTTAANTNARAYKCMWIQ
jgi:trimeric autotransporter adhesin